jgi:hypothetical protein
VAGRKPPKRFERLELAVIRRYYPQAHALLRRCKGLYHGTACPDGDPFSAGVVVLSLTVEQYDLLKTGLPEEAFRALEPEAVTTSLLAIRGVL